MPHSGSVRQTSNRKFSSSSSQKDLWFICKQGSVVELDLALLSLKKNGGNIDARNVFGLTPLHIATWRNHVPIVKRLLAAGADPDSRVCYSNFYLLLCPDKYPRLLTCYA